jgi:hypothetical protein
MLRDKMSSGPSRGGQKKFPICRTFERHSNDLNEMKGFYAPLGTPLGANTAYLVRDHFYDIGRKSVGKITV